MQSPSSTPLADIIASLAVLHCAQHQALLDLRSDQERRFQAIVQAQKEDRERFRSWIDREVHAEAAGPPAAPMHLPLHKMGPQDDPEAFLELFEKSAEACGWPREQWPVRLIPLLSGEAQVAAQQLPVANLLVFYDLKRAIIQRVGRSPEQYSQHFRSLDLDEAGRPFAMAQQHRDSCLKWLLSEVPSSWPSTCPAPGAGRDRPWTLREPKGPASVSPLSPRQFSNPLPATGVAGRSGLACWRCGDPEHFVDRGPVMEVGMMILVPDIPQVTPGQAGEYQIPIDGL